MTRIADDLRVQAHHLFNLDLRKPKQASLRRAVSAAYYALFHLLVVDAVLRVSPKVPAGLAARIARSLTHVEIREVCQSIASANPSEILCELHPVGFSADLRIVAQAFATLQEARHHADYDIAISYSRSTVLESLLAVDKAFTAWKKVRKQDEATVFLAALLFTRRWSK